LTSRAASVLVLDDGSRSHDPPARHLVRPGRAPRSARAGLPADAPGQARPGLQRRAGCRRPVGDSAGSGTRRARHSLAGGALDAPPGGSGRATLLGPGTALAASLRGAAAARRLGAGLGVVHRVPAVPGHGAGRVGAGEPGRPRTLARLPSHRHWRHAHRPHEARGRTSRARVHAHRRRQLRPHQQRDRSGLRHRGAVPRRWSATRATTVP